MNSVTRWNPFREMEELSNRLNTLFQGANARHPETQENLTVAEWAPLVDILEDDQKYLIKVELPEMKRDDIKVTVENGVLCIAGERKFQKEEKHLRYHRVERSYGSFVRSFTLPVNADPAKVTAEFKDGVLQVNLTKSEAARPRQVEVKVS